MPPFTVTIRDLHGAAELDACVALQHAIWGPGFNEAVPASLLAVVPRVGGVAAGAFGPEGELLGFVFGITGPDRATRALVHWSDMLGVAPAARGQGIAARLKAWQADAARRAGATRMQWTFDPMQLRNAWLNLESLGARVVAYLPDFYPASTSPLHAGGTDRLLVEWRLDAGEAPRGRDDQGDRARRVERRIPVPADASALAPGALRDWRRELRTQFEDGLASGLAVIGVERGEEPGYLLGR
ncbi:MAG TPA: GNAT family N-acetyltransferase [Gemmatimonadaceae bacterium]